jgi:hypothetical protein
MPAGQGDDLGGQRRFIVPAPVAITAHFGHQTRMGFYL